MTTSTGKGGPNAGHWIHRSTVPVAALPAKLLRMLQPTFCIGVDPGSVRILGSGFRSESGAGSPASRCGVVGDAVLPSPHRNCGRTS
jgi:hypothetical protein